MERFEFTFPLSCGTGANTLFAEIDGQADVFEDATIEIKLYDFTSREYVDAPEYLRQMMDTWLRVEKADAFHAAMDEDRRKSS